MLSRQMHLLALLIFVQISNTWHYIRSLVFRAFYMVSGLAFACFPVASPPPPPSPGQDRVQNKKKDGSQRGVRGFSCTLCLLYLYSFHAACEEVLFPVPSCQGFRGFPDVSLGLFLLWSRQKGVSSRQGHVLFIFIFIFPFFSFFFFFFLSCLACSTGKKNWDGSHFSAMFYRRSSTTIFQLPPIQWFLGLGKTTPPPPSYFAS